MPKQNKLLASRHR